MKNPTPEKSVEEIAKEIANSGANVDLADRIVIETNIETALQTERNKRDEMVEAEKELVWLIDEAWELQNKPWRFFGSMIKAIEKFGNVACTSDYKKGSQDFETIQTLKLWKEASGNGKLKWQAITQTNNPK